MSAVAHMAKPAAACPYCRSTDIVTDYSAGDEICRSCAAVINERLVCDEAEWRDYENDDRGARDSARCGGKGDSADALEASVILGGSAALRKSLTRTHLSSSAGGMDMKVAENTSQIHELTARLGLTESVSEKAAEIIRKVTKEKMCRGFGSLPIMTAVIYLACRLEGHPRTQKEICHVLHADVRSVNRIYTRISKSMDVNNAMLRILPKHMVPRLCAQLRIGSIISDAVAVCEAVATAGLLDGNSPAVAAAAVMYFVCQQNKVDLDFDHVCKLVCEKAVINAAYQKLVPYNDLLCSALRTDSSSAPTSEKSRSSV